MAPEYVEGGTRENTPAIDILTPGEEIVPKRHPCKIYLNVPTDEQVCTY